MKMKFKKETKHTVVYESAEAETVVVPVRSVYVDKIWLAANPKERSMSGWPQEIELEVK